MLAANRLGIGMLSALVLLAPGARADEDARLQQAVKKGVTYLKKIQNADGSWSYEQHTVGMTALAALTLLESKVPADDLSVEKAVDYLRRSSIEVTRTYCLALAILFFDRLGDAGDDPLIEALTNRLLAGQNKAGGWGYICPAPSTDEVQRLLKLHSERRVLEGRDKAPKKPEGRAFPKDNPDPPRNFQRPGPPVRPNMPVLAGGVGDNSNTQFAALALWVARRHQLPVEDALRRIEARFRQMQNADGGWPYVGVDPAMPAVMMPRSVHTMTCAGLLGLAIGQGLANDGEEPKSAKDKGINSRARSGLLYLTEIVGQTGISPTWAGWGGPSRWAPHGGPGGPGVPRAPGGAGPQESDSRDASFYFLWSLERVAIIYGLETIGKKDWYKWGCHHIFKTQQSDGHWEGAWGRSGADTCFALLFLLRANLAKDLTASMRGKVMDPGEITLKSGGVGGGGNFKGNGGKAPKESVPASGAKVEPAPAASVAGKEKPVPPSTSTEPVEGKEQITRLKIDLIEAKASRQDDLLKQYKDSKGVEYTQALAEAIPQLSGDTRKKARDALSERLTRMTSATLRGRLQDDDAEIRKAAALACGMKEDKSHVPDLIPLLDDPEASVGRAAYVALHYLTGKDFGPVVGAARAERKEAMDKWKAWWDKEKSK